LENQRKVFAIARIAINIVGMLGAVRRLSGFQVTMGELIVVAGRSCRGRCCSSLTSA
jgi:hypothetical protein